jgi:hypothetical protein
MSDEKLLGKSLTAPKGRNMIACGIATEERDSLYSLKP